jgi:hypothetical protein
MTEEDKLYRQGRSEAQYESTMICTTIAYIGIIVSFLILLIINTIRL